MPVTINGTTGIAGVDGSNTTPAIKGGTSTGTGVFYGTNTVSLATGGTTAVTVDSSQNVGIGTTSVTQINSTLTGQMTGNFRVGGTNATGMIGFGDFTAATPNVGVWRGSTDQSFTGGNYLKLSGYDGITFSASNAAITSQTERARIDSSGNLLIGTTSNTNGTKLNVYQSSSSFGAATIEVPSTSSGFTAVFFKNPNGNVGSITTAASSTAYNTSSDYRLKENVQPMSGALNKVAQLKPVTFNWKVDGSDGQGFIAHELQAVVPDAVTGEKDAVDAEGNPKYQGVDTSFLVATLTAAIQELSAKLDAAEARIAALEAK